MRIIDRFLEKASFLGEFLLGAMLLLSDAAFAKNG
jgi:hypothetical protein